MIKNNLVILLFTISLASSMIFGFVLVMDYLYKNQNTNFIYCMMKVILIFYLFPSIILSQFIIGRLFEYTVNFVGEEDFNTIMIVDRVPTLLSSGPQIINFILIAWSIGMCVAFFVIFLKGKKVLTFIITDSIKIVDCRELQIVENIKTELSIKKNVELYRSNLIKSPFLTGLFKPKILLPEIHLSEEELKLCLKHELVHLKENDLWFKSLLGLIQVIHWFNPIIIIYKKRFHKICEYACDKKVIEKFDSHMRSRYAKLIVRLDSVDSEYEQILALTDKKYKKIERRIYKIMIRPKKERKTVLFIMMAAFIAACPIATYASALGVVEAQDHLIKMEQAKNSVFTSLETENERVLDIEIIGERLIGFSDGRKGVNNVDVTISATGQAHFNDISLSEGDVVSCTLGSDRSSDVFRIGIVDSRGVGVVYESTNGGINESYTIPKDGTYKVYSAGRNSDGNRIHITGIIRIE